MQLRFYFYSRHKALKYNKNNNIRNKLNNNLNILYFAPIQSHPLAHGNRARICETAQQFKNAGYSVHFVFLDVYFNYSKQAIDSMQDFWDSVYIIPTQKMLLNFSTVELDAWYDKKIESHIINLCEKYHVNAIVCNYVFQSKLLDCLPSHILKIIDTHDKMADRKEMLKLHKIPEVSFSCSQQDEQIYLNRADVILGITQEETAYFKTLVPHRRVINAGYIEKPKFINKSYQTLQHIGIVASDNVFNQEMLKQFLTAINQLIIQNNNKNKNNGINFIIHIAGDIKKVFFKHDKLIKNTIFKRYFGSAVIGSNMMLEHFDRDILKNQWINFHGFVPDIKQFYEKMDLVISPMFCGTGMNIKTVQALAYGVPLLTTKQGARGLELFDTMHQHTSMASLVKSLWYLYEDSAYQAVELNRLAALSREFYNLYYLKNNFVDEIGESMFCK